MEPACQNICDAITRTFGHESGSPKSALALSLEHFPFGCYGTLFVAWGDEERGAADWEAVCREFATRASSAITRGVHQAHLQFQLDHKLGEISRLRDIGLEFGLETNVREMMSSILEAARKEANMDRGVVRLYDEKTQRWMRMAVSGPFSELEVPLEIEFDPTLTNCLETRRPEETAGDEPEWLDYLGTLPDDPRKAYLSQEGSRVAVPLRIEREFLGAIILSRVSGSISIAPDIIEYLEILSQYASIAIHTAQLHAREIELARPFALIGAMMAGFLHVMGNKANNALATYSNLADPYLPDTERPEKAPKSWVGPAADF